MGFFSRPDFLVGAMYAVFSLDAVISGPRWKGWLYFVGAMVLVAASCQHGE